MRADLIRILADERITPVFQPVVDLFSGQVLGYEVLSRAPAPFEDPQALFERAAEWDLAWDLENVCRLQALRKIAQLPLPIVGKRKFFINVSHFTFNDRRFESGFLVSHLAKLGIEKQRIVIDIRESAGIEDHDIFQSLMRHYREQGFEIALDNFGSGHSSLITLMEAAPSYLKMDRELVSGIDRHSYKQNLAKSIVSFADSVGCKMVAEGIERVEELETLVRLGVRSGQGFLLGRPVAEPELLDAKTFDLVIGVSQRFYYPRMASNATIVEMALRPPVFKPGALTCEELDALFRNEPAVDHVVVVSRSGKLLGIVARHHLWAAARGPSGFDRIAKRYVEDIREADALTVRENMDIRVLGRLALQRQRDEEYDPVIVVDADGAFVGTITMKQLLAKSINVEIEIASNANPLTGLPGNMMIQTWLQEAVSSPEFSLIYGDLDCFKEYNDTYGFSQGDEMIKITAQVFRDHLAQISDEARLGHVGGDDFVVVVSGPISEKGLAAICEEFDRLKRPLFDDSDMDKGSFVAVNRQGAKVDVPLVTLSLAALTQTNTGPSPHPGQFGKVSASLKKKIKATNATRGRSGYLRDRRRGV